MADRPGDRGLTLVWPDGKVLRVNLRAEGRFGVDDGRRQILEGWGNRLETVARMRSSGYFARKLAIVL